MAAKILRLALAAVVLGALAGGAWWWTQRREHPRAARLKLHGNVDIRQVELAFNASGRIDRILVQEGDSVAEGQLLAVLDTQRLNDTVARARASAAAQAQVLARLEAGSRPEEIAQARANVEAARVEARNAEHSYRRLRDLVARHFVAQQQADDARAAAEAARARLDAARQALRLLVLGPRKEDIAAARATLEADRAALALARRDLVDASLYAPSAGVIEDRILQPGDMASPQQPVFTLALTQPLWVRAYVPETDLGRVHIGGLAEVTTDSYPGKRYRAWIGYISPTAEFTPKSVETREVRSQLVYQIRVFVCAPKGELRLGMPAAVEIALDQPALPVGDQQDACRGRP